MPECLKHLTLFGDTKSTTTAAWEGIISYFEESGHQIGALAIMAGSHLAQIPNCLASVKSEFSKGDTSLNATCYLFKKKKLQETEENYDNYSKNPFRMIIIMIIMV